VPAGVRGCAYYRTFAYTAVILFAVVLVFSPGRARAHELIDRAAELSQNAEFEAALAALSDAETGTDLTREDVVQLLLQRALVHFALQATEEMSFDLNGLASLEPHFEFDVTIPPPVAEMFPGGGGRLALELTAEPFGSGMRVVAVVNNDAGQLVHDIVVSGRVANGEWRDESGYELILPAAPGETIEYYGFVVGPGEAILANTGSEEEPLTATRPKPEKPIVVAPPPEDEDDGDGMLWVWIGGGAAVAIATVIVIVAVSSGGESDETAISGPRLVE
jgi:hypothetical protein